MLAIIEIPEIKKEALLTITPQEIAFIKELNKRLDTKPTINYYTIDCNDYREYVKENKDLKWLKERATNN